MKLIGSLLMIVIPIALSFLCIGCASSPQLYIKSMVASSTGATAHDYKYAGPYQFVSHSQVDQ